MPHNDGVGDALRANRMASSSEQGGRWLITIAIFKLVKTAMLIALAAGLVKIVEHGPEQTIGPWFEAAHFDARGRIAAKLLQRLFTLDRTELKELTAATFVYAGVFFVEGVGLLLRKVWAEYLTLGVTISFLPFEIAELVHESSVPKWLTLVLNLVVVGYLAARRIAHALASRL